MCHFWMIMLQVIIRRKEPVFTFAVFTSLIFRITRMDPCAYLQVEKSPEIQGIVIWRRRIPEYLVVQVQVLPDL